jgi:hypothetical protein
MFDLPPELVKLSLLQGVVAIRAYVDLPAAKQKEVRNLLVRPELCDKCGPIHEERLADLARLLFGN